MHFAQFALLLYWEKSKKAPLFLLHSFYKFYIWHFHKYLNYNFGILSYVVIYIKLKKSLLKTSKIKKGEMFRWLLPFLDCIDLLLQKSFILEYKKNTARGKGEI